MVPQNSGGNDDGIEIIDGFDINHPQLRTIYPRPELKQAVLVVIPEPATNADDLLPTFIQTGWGQVMTFFGSYYGVVVNGVIDYGSAKIQWENMHTLLDQTRGLWVKTGIPQAYQIQRPSRLTTMTPGNPRETVYTFRPGDWLVRQPGGELQHIKFEKIDGIYHTDVEAHALGLNQMSPEQFADWAVAQASAKLSAGANA